MNAAIAIFAFKARVSFIVTSILNMKMVAASRRFVNHGNLCTDNLKK